MLIDNRNDNPKLHEWISQQTRTGQLDAVTGYFTIGALAWLSEELDDRIDKFRFVLGELTQPPPSDDRPLDLLNENISVEGALQLTAAARRAVAFLEQDSVLLKTVDAHFCHAKATVHHAASAPQSYGILGSSNLTEAGLGLRPAGNIELNRVGQGTDAEFDELKRWFKELWDSPEARKFKRIDGKRVDFKEYLIEQISKVFVQYTPRDLYYKTLFEMFGRPLMDFQGDPDITRNLGRLENSRIWNSLYEFQEKGVLSLIKILETHGGAILADAVGLGKTWSALAVIKYYQAQGRDAVILCPKKLDANWRQYKRHHHSRFEQDRFEYIIRYHTDLQDERLYTRQDRLGRDFFQSDRPKLIVIDESHNLRNSKSNRYKLLVKELLQANEDVKVLLLSATPINNTLIDVRNQFKLLVKDRSDGFQKTLGINSVDGLFRRANQAFNTWRNENDRSLSAFIRLLPRNFFRMTDALIVARTRDLIAGHTDELSFPEKEPPQNIFLEGLLIGEYEAFEDFLDAMPKYFAGYMPAYYIEQEEDVDVLENERQRDFFLTKMMLTLLIKRLESGWKAFQSTIEVVYRHHLHVLNMLREYRAGMRQGDGILADFGALGEETDWLAELSIGKREIKISEIDTAGMFNKYKNNVEADVRALSELRDTLEVFERLIARETTRDTTRDEKLQRLMDLIATKQKENDNQKVVIFTAYTATADYVYDELLRRGWSRLAVVTGTHSRTHDSAEKHRRFEPILQRFAPFTKLFLGKEWEGFDIDDAAEIMPQYDVWRTWIRENKPRTAALLDAPIDILIATDCLSEGQNLQDADFVVNLDIHWNPVRCIQRMGRIDRLGSPNDRVYAANFWPTKEVNGYLRLQSRVEDKMMLMRTSGVEIPAQFTPEMDEMLDDEHIQQSQEAQLLRQMETTWDDIEGVAGGIGFDTLSLENFRQDLMVELSEDEQRYLDMPDGIYSGFQQLPDFDNGEGLIALLRSPTRLPAAPRAEHEQLTLLYLDMHGAEIVSDEKDILATLAAHKDCTRCVPAGVDDGTAAAIDGFHKALMRWFEVQRSAGDDTAEDAAGTQTSNMLSAILTVRKGALKVAPGEQLVAKKFDSGQYDLVLWLAVGRSQ